MTIRLPAYDVEITLVGDLPNRTGTITSKLFDAFAESSDSFEYAKGAADAIESFLLASACNGSMSDPDTVAKMLEDVLEAVSNNS